MSTAIIHDILKVKIAETVSKPDFCVLKHNLQSECHNSQGFTDAFIILFMYLNVEVASYLPSLTYTDTDITAEVYFTDDRGSIIFRNKIMINSGGVQNFNDRMPLHEIKIFLANFLNGNSLFPNISQQNLVSVVLKEQRKGKYANISIGNGLFSLLYTPGTAGVATVTTPSISSIVAYTDSALTTLATSILVGSTYYFVITGSNLQGFTVFTAVNGASVNNIPYTNFPSNAITFSGTTNTGGTTFTSVAITIQSPEGLYPPPLIVGTYNILSGSAPAVNATFPSGVSFELTSNYPLVDSITPNVYQGEENVTFTISGSNLSNVTLFTSIGVGATGVFNMLVDTTTDTIFTSLAQNISSSNSVGNYGVYDYTNMDMSTGYLSTPNAIFNLTGPTGPSESG